MNKLSPEEKNIAQVLSTQLFSSTQVLELREILGGSLRPLLNQELARKNLFKVKPPPSWVKRVAKGDALKKELDQLRESIDRFQKRFGYSLSYLSAFDEEFPHCLRSLSYMPSGIFYSGSLQEGFQGLGLIGTRKPSLDGRSLVPPMVHECVSRELWTVSGLAPGIDSCVHQETLQQKGKTLAVLGSGHGYPLSIQRDRMLEKILEKGGAVLSEYAPFSFPKKKNFILRNRLIAAFSKKLVVFEAALKSGTFITAGEAAKLEKQIWIPWMSYRNRTTEGLHELYMRFPSVQLFLRPRDVFLRFGDLSGQAQSESQQEILFEDLPFEIHRFLKRKQLASMSDLRQEFQDSTGKLERALFKLRLFGHIEEKEGGHFVPRF
jgi:DNA processing protein